MDSFGIKYKLSDTGTAYDEKLCGIIEGCPKGVFIDDDFIRQELARRAPSAHLFSTRRKEEDRVFFTSGIRDNMTTGETVCFEIFNNDARINPSVNNVIRPSHCSFTYKNKYGCKDNAGCGRASARQTVCRVVAGAIAKLILKPYHVSINAETLSVAASECEGDTMGALVQCTVKNLPVGLGEPVYDKFHARLAYAMLSINAAKGFEIGKGFEAASMCGSSYNDLQNPDFSFKTNHDGGVQAGITNGQDVCFKVAFKPIPTLQMEQNTIDFEGHPVSFIGNDRNDKCVIPRVLPVVEAMTAMVVVDFLLRFNDEK